MNFSSLNLSVWSCTQEWLVTWDISVVSYWGSVDKGCIDDVHWIKIIKSKWWIIIFFNKNLTESDIRKKIDHGNIPMKETMRRLFPIVFLSKLFEFIDRVSKLTISKMNATKIYVITSNLYTIYRQLSVCLIFVLLAMFDQ